MPTKPTEASSPWPIIAAYGVRFGKIPAHVGKFLANSADPATFPKFEEMLKEQLVKEEPVMDWEAFVEPLLRPRKEP
jgi:hypothetical protein